MGIFQIPRYILPHSVSVKTELTHDAWGNCTYRTDEISNVRLVKCDVVKRRKNDREDSSDAVMYFDMQNSAPDGFTFSIGQVVEFGGESYEISEIKPVVSTSQVHHLEIKLFKRRSE